GGRDELQRAEAVVDGARRRADRAGEALDAAPRQFDIYESDTIARARWEATNGWRLDRLAEIDRGLAHHWADVGLAAVRADDPLSFGVDRLREERRVADAE